MQPFDVVVVPFPFSDRLAEKRRPALVISHRDLPTKTGRVWVAMITSVSETSFGDVSISNLATAGLPVPSILRASKIATIDATRVLKVVGHLADDDQRIARRAIMACSGF